MVPPRLITNCQETRIMILFSHVYAHDAHAHFTIRFIEKALMTCPLIVLASLYLLLYIKRVFSCQETRIMIVYRHMNNTLQKLTDLLKRLGQDTFVIKDETDCGDFKSYLVDFEGLTTFKGLHYLEALKAINDDDSCRATWQGVASDTNRFNLIQAGIDISC